MKITSTVDDSRGRTKSETISINVESYKLPAITSMIYQQCNADGTANPTGNSTKITMSGSLSNVKDRNSASLLLKWKKAADVSYKTKTIDISEWEFTVSTIVNNTTTDETYEFIAVLADKIRSTEFVVTTGRVTMSLLAGGRGVRFFGEAESEGFWIGDVDYTITDGEYDELLSLMGGK